MLCCKISYDSYFILSLPAKSVQFVWTCQDKTLLGINFLGHWDAEAFHRNNARIIWKSFLSFTPKSSFIPY